MTLFLCLGIAACAAPTETVEIVGTPVEVTVVVENVIQTVEVETESIKEPEESPAPKKLVICQTEEPNTLYRYGSGKIAARNIQHALFTNYITNLSFSFQPDGLVKVPRLSDEDAVINWVEVVAGDTVVDANNDVVTLETGVLLKTPSGEIMTFDGTSLLLSQMVVEFEMEQTIWSDGTPVKASDSVYSFNLAADPDTPIDKFLVDRTASYEAIGERTVRWTGLPGFIDSTYINNFWLPEPEHILGGFSAAELLKAEESSRLPTGDGPFKIVEWVTGDKISLEPNPFYFRAGLPFLDSVTYKFVSDSDQLITQLLSGECDIGTSADLTTEQIPFLLTAESNGLLTPHFQTGTVWEHIDFGINPEPGYAATRPDWFEDVRVRQAMSMCTDRQRMVDELLYGRSQPIHSYIPDTHPLYAHDLIQWPYDVAAANALLDEVGYVDTDGDGIREDPASGLPFQVTLGTTTLELRQQVSQLFKENQRECGIDIQLNFLPSSVWFADGPVGPLFGTQFDLGEFGWEAGVEPLCQFYMSDQIPTAENGWSGQNATGFSNDAFDAACLKAISSLPGSEAYRQGHEEAQHIWAEQVPVIPLFTWIKVAVTQDEILNFFVDSTQNSELYNIYELDIQR